MRFFNTEGPVRSDEHYAIPPLIWTNMDEILGLIQAKRYFVLHSPRQIGKTSALICLRDLLNSSRAGHFRCVDVNVEVAQVSRNDVTDGMHAILSSLAMSAKILGDDYVASVWPALLAEAGPNNVLASWCFADSVADRACFRFNEAPAFLRGKHLVQRRLRRRGRGFNEAPAFLRGKQLPTELLAEIVQRLQ